MTEIGLSIDELDTPFLWTDLDILEANIATLAAYFAKAGVGWRPHTKGNKVPAIAQKLVAAGALGVTCAKLGEAEIMAGAGIRDILIANQMVGVQKYRRLAGIQRHAHVLSAVDSTATLAGLSAAALAIGVEIPLLVELNTGMERAGVQPGEATVTLARQVHETPGLRLEGLMSWEGHTMAVADVEERHQAIRKSVGLLVESAELCRAAGLPIEIVSCGGTGTVTVTPFLKGITEVQAGGVIFSDLTYARYDVPTQPALFVRSVVTSRSAPNRIIFDAGWKTLPVWMRQAEAIGLENVEQMRMSAEHGIVTLTEPNQTVQVGDLYDFIPSYGDTTVFLHDTLYGIRQGVVETVWEVAGRGKLR